MELVYPMFMMVLLTTVVGVLTPYKRIRAAYARELDHRYFRLMSNYEISEKIAKYGRNLDNLFEVPVLFYAAGICALSINYMNQTFLVFMWVFVITRIVHSAIHLTYNNPMHRFIPYMLSLLCVLVLWGNIVVFAS